MSELSWRKPRVEEFEAVTAVVNASERRDRLPEVTPADEVRHDLADEDVDAIVVESDGRITGYSYAYLPPEPGREQHFATLFAYVHPDWRTEVGDRLVAWAVASGEVFLVG